MHFWNKCNSKHVAEVLAAYRCTFFPQWRLNGTGFKRMWGWQKICIHYFPDPGRDRNLNYEGEEKLKMLLPRVLATTNTQGTDNELEIRQSNLKAHCSNHDNTLSQNIIHIWTTKAYVEMQCYVGKLHTRHCK